MELKFPFKNLTVNHLWEFRENKFLNDFFIKYKHQQDNFYKEQIEKQVDFFLDFLPDFENEILQIIQTSNQKTIDTYFNELIENCSWVCNIDSDGIKHDLNEINEERYNKFIKDVNEKSEEYFKKEERTKYKHLEKYESYQFSLIGFGLYGNPREGKKVKKTNYNYYCIEQTPNLFDLSFFDDYINFLSNLTSKFQGVCQRYIEKFENGEIIASEEDFYDKVIVYVEGQHDIDLIFRAAELLKETEILNKIELRQRGGFRNLDKIWKFYNENSVEITGQIKILLYDCDTNKSDEDFGYIYKRTIPTVEGHIISKGIENLFNNITTQKAIKAKKEFIDFNIKKGTKRGIEYHEEINEVNKDEKANFCTWMSNNGTKEDFNNFKIIFDLIREIITNANTRS